MEFKSAPLDRGAKILTGAVVIFLAGLAAVFIIKVPFGVIFVVLMMLILVIPYLLSPKRMILTNTHLIIEKHSGQKTNILLNGIQAYTQIPDFSKLTVARTFGSGGLFGYFGMFSTAEYGDIHCHLTALKNIVLIKTGSRTYAVSPAQHSLFQERLAQLPSASGQRARLEPITEAVHYARPLILIVPVVLFIVITLFVILQYAQLPERIAVHFDVHGNPDGWGPKTSYLISGLVPSAILLLISFGIFFTVRRAARNPAVTPMLVIIIACIQLFIAYTTVETFWVNKYGTHLIPLVYGIAAYVVIIIGLYVFYYRKLFRNNRS